MKNAYLKIIHIWICISPIIRYLLKNKFRFLTVYGAWCMASIDVKLGSQIWRILLQLRFQFKSEAEISPELP
jgi:hypothetical protein